jgi:hypothetical protein
MKLIFEITAAPQNPLSIWPGRINSGSSEIGEPIIPNRSCWAPRRIGTVDNGPVNTSNQLFIK